jgi:hypothetical protein
VVHSVCGGLQALRRSPVTACTCATLGHPLSSHSCHVHGVSGHVHIYAIRAILMLPYIHTHPSLRLHTRSSTRAVLPLPHLMHMQVWKSCRIHSSLRKASWPTHHLHGKQMSAGPSPPAQSGSWERAVKCLTMCALHGKFLWYFCGHAGSVVANVMFEQAVLAFVWPHRAAAQAGGKTPGLFDRILLACVACVVVRYVNLR